LLPWIEDELDAEGAAFLGVLDHRARIVRRDDGESAVAGGAERQRTGIPQRAGVERGDLVVVLVRAAEERGAELARNLPRQRRIDAGGLEPLPVLAEILAGGGHQQWRLAEQRQRVRDVGRAAAAPLVHRVDQEAQADALHVLREEMLGELPRK